MVCEESEAFRMTLNQRCLQSRLIISRGVDKSIRMIAKNFEYLKVWSQSRRPFWPFVAKMAASYTGSMSYVSYRCVSTECG